MEGARRTPDGVRRAFAPARPAITPAASVSSIVSPIR
jgi:hypothetical protein